MVKRQKRRKRIVLEKEEWIQKESKILYSYRISHAQIAQFYIKALQASLDYFNLNGNTFRWKELCALSQFLNMNLNEDLNLS